MITLASICNINTEINLGAIIVALIGFFGSLIINKVFNQPKINELYKEQLNNLYWPMFSLIEPNLNKNIDVETAKNYATELNQIIKSNYCIVPSNLFLLVEQFSEQVMLDKDYMASFTDLSFYIAKLFDKTRRKLKYPTRSFSYKFCKNQFDLRTHKSLWNSIKEILSIWFDTFKEAIPVFIGCFIGFSLYLLYQFILSLFQ